MTRSRLALGPELALVVCTMVWGVTFVAVRRAMAEADPLGFVAARFLLAALVLGIATAPRMRGMTGADLRAGAVIGVVLALGYGLQTAGMRTIDAGTSAFLTSLYVVIVPLAQWLLLRRRPRAAIWAGAALAFAGLLLMTGAPTQGLSGLGRGEWLTLGATLAIAAEILLIGAYAGRVDAMRVTVLQLAFAGIAAGIAAVATGHAPPPASPAIILILAFLALASAAIQATMNWAQRRVSPARATLIYAGEPVWAGIAAAIAGERMGSLALLGAALILAAILVSSRSGG